MNPLERLAEYAEPLTRHPYILRVRRNHGLEHATIHVLNGRNYRLSGRSGESGFILVGDVPTAQVESAVAEALSRMKAGEHKLAVHPNCGTNLTATILLVTAAAFLGSLDWQNSQLRPPEGTFSLGEEGNPAARAESPIRRRPGSGRSLLDRITVTAGLMTLALLVSTPLGMRLQRLTTLTTIGNRVLAQVVPLKRGQAYRVTFAKPQ